MLILALDVGTSTGWALLGATGRIESGTQRFDLKRGESPGMRFIAFTRWLAEVARVPDDAAPSPIELIAFEQPHHRGGAATELLIGFTTRIVEFCARHGIQHAAVHSATLKRWATGDARADKQLMRAACAARWGHMPQTDDEADAVALVYYARQTWDAA
jgi:Holliday junction resolvasome RuvABC endonuclease subunit